MADELPPNLEQEEVPGGPAVQPAKPKNSLTEKAGQAVEKGKEAVKDQAKKAVTKVVRQAVMQAVRSVIVWLGAVLGPYAIPVVIVVLAIIIIVVAITAAYGNRANKGLHGLSQTQAADKYSSSVMGDIRVVLGDQIMVSNNPDQNYFSQGDPNFNTAKLNGSWEHNEPYLNNAGCGITAATMMIRYYGVTDVDPVRFANEMANGGSLNLRPDWMLHYVNPLLKSQGKKEKTVAQISHNASTIASYIKNGDPVLAQGNPICGSDGGHYVLIVGISKDYQNFVISDPAAGKPRQSAARYCSNPDLLGHAKALIVLQDAK